MCNIFGFYPYNIIEGDNIMKRFLISFKEVSYGVVEVFAETEEEARAIADSEGTRFVDSSTLELGTVEKEEDIEDY